MRKATLGTIVFTVFLDLVGFGLVVPYLPGVARSHGASDLVAALLGSAFSLMQFLFVPFWGRLSDRKGRRPILLVSIGASALGMILLGSATSLWMVLAARIWSGICTANISVAQAYIADVTRPEDRAHGMSMIGVGIGMGFILGPVIGGLLEAHSPLTRAGALPAYVAAGLAVINFLLALTYLPESLPEKDRGKYVRPASPFNLERFRVALALPGVRIALLFNFVVVFSFSGHEATFRLFTEDAFQMSDSDTGWVLGFAGVVLILVQGLLFRRLAAVLSERTLICAGAVIQSVGFACVAAAPSVKDLAAGGPSRAQLAVAALVVGSGVIALGSALTSPSVSTFVSRCAHSQNQGVVLGVLQSVGALARVWGPGTGGLLYQTFGPRAPYVAAAVGMSLAGAVAMSLKPPPVAAALPAKPPIPQES
jgi:MFS transporter, DHA1 family, tetracycline resistance protein